MDKVNIAEIKIIDHELLATPLSDFSETKAYVVWSNGQRHYILGEPETEEGEYKSWKDDTFACFHETEPLASHFVDAENDEILYAVFMKQVNNCVEVTICKPPRFNLKAVSRSIMKVFEYEDEQGFEAFRKRLAPVKTR